MGRKEKEKLYITLSIGMWRWLEDFKDRKSVNIATVEEGRLDEAIRLLKLIKK